MSRVGSATVGFLTMVLLGCGTKTSGPPHTAPPPPPATPSPTASSGPPVPTWAALTASCTGAPSLHEAILKMQGVSGYVLADVTDAHHPVTLCTFSGGAWGPQLVDQRTVSWMATQGGPGSPGLSGIFSLDVFSGGSRTVTTWSGGGFLDGVHAWSGVGGYLAYFQSSSSALSYHLLSAGSDRTLASYGPIPGRGVGGDDEGTVQFAADGSAVAFVQTFVPSTPSLAVWQIPSGSNVLSRTGTMAVWAGSGQKLYFRDPGSSTIQVYDEASSAVSVAFGLAVKWDRPDSLPGTDALAFTAPDSSGAARVWYYASNGRAGGQLPNERGGATFLNPTTIFYLEEGPCTGLCPSSYQPTGRTFIYDIGSAAEASSTIASVGSVWPFV